jgi:cell shape-determining protein MreD
MRRGRLGLVILVVVLVVLHFLLRVGMGFGELAPDLLILSLLLVAREVRAGTAAAVGLVLGILEGSLLPFALGSVALVFTLMGYLGARTRELFSGDSLVLLALYLFVGKWVTDALLYLFAGAVFRPAGLSTLLFISPLAALYVMVAGLLAVSAYRAVS